MSTYREQDAPLLSRRDAALYLAISQRKLDELRASGRLTCVRIGAAVRFHRDDLDAFISVSKEGGVQ